MGRVVLCGVDESAPPAVCEVAADLAGRLGLPLVIATVAEESPSARFEVYARRATERQAAQDRAQQVLDRLDTPVVDHLDATKKALVGDGVPTLIGLAQEEDAELIVVGSRGRGMLASLLLGSFSRVLIKSAPCPVVVVPPGALDPDGHARLGEERSASLTCGVPAFGNAERTVGFAVDLAGRLGDRLVVLFEQPATGHAAHDRAVPGEPEIVEYEGALAPGLEAVAHAEDARLVVIPGSEKGPLGALLEAAPETVLLRHSPSPVAVLPAGAKIEPGTHHYELRDAA